MNIYNQFDGLWFNSWHWTKSWHNSLHILQQSYLQNDAPLFYNVWPYLCISSPLSSLSTLPLRWAIADNKVFTRHLIRQYTSDGFCFVLHQASWYHVSILAYFLNSYQIGILKLTTIMMNPWVERHYRFKINTVQEFNGDLCENWDMEESVIRLLREYDVNELELRCRVYSNHSERISGQLVIWLEFSGQGNRAGSRYWGIRSYTLRDTWKSPYNRGMVLGKPNQILEGKKRERSVDIKPHKFPKLSLTRPRQGKESLRESGVSGTECIW